MSVEKPGQAGAQPSASSLEPVPAGPLIAPRAGAGYAIYFFDPPRESPAALFVEEAKKTPFALRGDAGTGRWRVDVRTPNVSEVPPQTESALEFFGRGISPPERARVAAAKQVLTLAFEYPGAEARPALREADRLVQRVAKRLNGVVYDVSTRETFSLAAWSSLRVEAWNDDAPEVLRHVAVHAYATRGHLRSVSLGMEKLGLPDVVVDGFDAREQARIDLLLGAILRSLVERPVAPGDGLLALQLSGRDGGAWVEIRAGRGIPDAGDNENRQVALTFAEGRGSTVQERQTDVLDSLGVSSGPRLLGASRDEELEAARGRARAGLGDVQRRYRAGLPPGAELYVKVPVGFKGQVEYMWMRVRSWDQGKLTGTLTDTAALDPTIVAGSDATSRSDDVFDWMIRFPGGRTEGGETNEVLRRKGVRWTE